MQRPTHPREKATNTALTPAHKAAEEEAAEEGEAEAMTLKDIDVTPHQKKITFFEDPPPPPPSTAGVTLFPKKGRSLVAKVVA